jgi:serine/threonine protein kinase/class 3 adenylate cyclase
MSARVEPSGQVVELRYATVAQTDPARFKIIDEAAKIYALLPQSGFRKLESRELAGDTPVFVFAAATDVTLATRLAIGSMTEREAWLFFRPIIHALEVAHRLGFVHGGLGPSAIGVRSDGTPQLDFVWLDVGAPRGDADLACVPPEAASGEGLDSSSDAFAVGALLKLALAGGTAITSAGVFYALIRELTRAERELRPSLAEVCELWHDLAPDRSRSIDLQATQLSFAPKVPVAEAPPPKLAPGMRLGRFELLRKIGEGGMGEVFSAVDRATGLRAAIKVLRADAGSDPAKRRRFRKEARILSEIQNERVAQLIEWNHDAGVDYIALEFVDGGDLLDLLEERGGRLPEREALSIAASVCEGLRDAHARGFVHRDIKPQNIMIARPTSEHAAKDAFAVKLCDFGIARVLDERTGTLAFTEETKLLGTPDFMAPEQAEGAPLSPATDVYALGVTLFYLIAGRLPFDAPDTISKLVAQVSEPAPRLADVASDVSEGASALVARMLQKSPAARFVDADMLFDAIQALLYGAQSSPAIHPVRPVITPERVVTIEFEWDLLASPAALWPYVSNTDRLNRAVGLPPADFERTTGEDGVETRAQNRVAGVDLRWREHPFEWIESKRWAVLRVFEQGVIYWFTVELELVPKPDGGTRLHYRMTFEPRHVFGRWIVQFEMRAKQHPALGRAFARIDAYATAHGPRPAGSDAFEPPKRLEASQRIALDRALDQLRADGIAETLIEALAAFCEHAADQEVAHLRPLAFATAHALDPDLVVEACLRAARQGLFVLLWQVLCPLCRIPADFAESLQALADHGRCPSCNVDFPIDFAQSLELVFRVAAEVRKSELRTYCVGGPAFAPHVVAQLRLAPQERLALDLMLAAGTYKVRSPQLPGAFPLQISSAARTQRGTVRFGPADGRQPSRLSLAPGAQSLELENLLDREIVVRVERAAPREDALTAARAACLASFRRLFPGEVLASGRLVAVGRTTFVLAGVQAQRELMRVLGDTRAFELLVQQLHAIGEVVAAEGGAVVKTASSITLCAFGSASAAARAAIALYYRLSAEAAVAAIRLDTRIVVHQGSAVAATIDGRLDYFGQSVEEAFDLVAQAAAGRVLLSSVLADDPNVMSELTSAGHALNLVDFEGAKGWGVAVEPAILERD